MSKTIEAEALTYTDHDWSNRPTVHKILVIEYHGGKPYAVYTDHSSFDFEYCKRYGMLYFRDVGSGLGIKDPDHQVHSFCKPSPPPAKIWIADGVRLHRWESTERPEVSVDDAMLLKMGYVRLKRPLLLNDGHGEKTRNPFEAGEESDGHFAYCSICKDYMPDDDDHICEHIVVTQSDEPIGVGGHEPKREYFFAALDWIRDEFNRDELGYRFASESDLIGALETVLRKNDLPLRRHIRSCIRRDAEDSDNWHDIEDGLAWLQTLSKNTVKENRKTLAWIREWRRKAPVRALAKRRAEAIKELESLATTTEKAKEITAALGLTGKKRADLDKVSLERIEAVLQNERPRSGQ